MFPLRAPTDCVQYFTGVSGSVKSYNYAGGQILAGQRYNNCIRTEKGYCAIQWKESSTTSPDPFSLDSITVAGANGQPPAPAFLCDTAYIAIPNLSPDGVLPIPVPIGSSQAFQSQQCGTNFGIEGLGAISAVLACEFQTFFHLCAYNQYSLFPLSAPAAICAGSVHCCTWHCSLSRRNYRLQLGLHSGEKI